ncbi:MAG: ADP-ribosylglycohydrolase family protein [Bacteroidia bacterium]|nr:ADP-ribosylglycohydrolase family protein [Bacteroidia bacterium]
MIGAIIGDIVGSRFEFNNHRSTRFELFAPESRFTDDTVCTVAVADWLLHSRDSFTPFLQGWCIKYPMWDYGAMFRGWIHNPVPYDSFGNGAAMRISPVGDWCANGFNPFVEMVKSVTAVSHDHPEGLKGAEVIACVIQMAWLGASKKHIRSCVERYGYDLNFTCASIRRTNQFNETCQVTVPQAIVAFLESKDFESAIRLSVSIGGDSDTIAAIAGGIAEAYYQSIPDRLIFEARDRLPGEMLNIIDEFYKKIGNERVRGSEFVPF